MAEQTHAIFATQAGGPEVLEWQSYTPRALNDREIRVRTAAAGLNFIEVYQRSGVYPVDYPFLLGGEGSGEVTEVAAGVTDFAVGDRVMTAAAEGTYSEEFIVSAEEAAAVPDSVSLKMRQRSHFRDAPRTISRTLSLVQKKVTRFSCMPGLVVSDLF